MFSLLCRSHTYFGLKARNPNSPVFGLMWLTQFTNRMPPPVRHWCDQGDQLLGYSWLLHDGKNFGVQELEEPTYTISTEFVKRYGGNHGGDWTVKITLIPKVNKAGLIRFKCPLILYPYMHLMHA